MLIKNISLSLCVVLSLALNTFAFERVISLAPSITRDIYLLDLQDKLVGVTMYCPDFAKGKMSIGTVQAPSMEQITALKPDLVIATKDGNDRCTVDKLLSMGIPVYVMESPVSFEDICDNFNRLGKHLGVPEKAKSVVKDAQIRVKTARTRIPQNAPQTVFWQVGSKPIFTVSKNSFVNEFMALTGTQNVFATLKARYPQVTREAVIAADPDIIVIVTMSGEMANEAQYWHQFKQMKAVKNKRVYFLHDMQFDNPTPVAIAEGIEKLLPIFYPTLKRK